MDMFQVDVLAIIDATLLEAPSTTPKLREARTAIDELIKAASAGTPERGDRAVSDGLWLSACAMPLPR